jgi:ribonuclease T1
VKWLAALAVVFCSTAFAFPSQTKASDLPREARETLALIKAGGPFSHAQDGRVFSNRENLLPLQTRGYYREYTVRTPGARDRGARRIVAGSGGDYYYTDDHYRSFKRILE